MILLLLAVTQAQAMPDTLRLADAIQTALTHRGEVRTAAARVAGGRALVRQAGTIPNPVARWSYTDDPPRKHASVEQPLDWLLTRGARRGAARHHQDALTYDSAQRVANVAADVRIAFNDVLASQDRILLVEAQRQLADSLLAIADRRLAAGDISRLERDQVALEQARTLLARSQAREALASANADLVRSLGLPDTASMPAIAGRLEDGLDAQDSVVETETPPLLAAALADSLARRVEVTAAARARIPFPAFEIGADWADPGAPGATLLLVGVSIPIPLWHQGGSEVALASATALEAAAQLGETRAMLRADQVSAWATLHESARRARIIQDSLLPAARHLRERAEEAYAEGETGVLPLLEALRTERDIAGLRLDALTAWQHARAEWLRLQGVIE